MSSPNKNMAQKILTEILKHCNIIPQTVQQATNSHLLQESDIDIPHGIPALFEYSELHRKARIMDQTVTKSLLGRQVGSLPDLRLVALACGLIYYSRPIVGPVLSSAWEELGNDVEEWISGRPVTNNKTKTMAQRQIEVNPESNLDNNTNSGSQPEPGSVSITMAELQELNTFADDIQARLDEAKTRQADILTVNCDLEDEVERLGGVAERLWNEREKFRLGGKDLKKRLEDLQAEYNELEDDRDEWSEMAEEMAIEYQGELDEMTTDRDNLQNQVAQLETDNQTLESSLAQKLAEQKASDERRAELESSVAEAAKALSDAAAAKQEQDSRVEELEAFKSQQEKSAAEAESLADTTNAQADPKLSQELEDLHEKYNALKDSRDTWKATCEALENQADVKAVQALRDQIASDAAHNERRIGALETHLGMETTNREYAQEVARDLRQKRMKLEDELKNVTEQYDNLELSYQELDHMHDAEERANEEKDEEITTLKAENDRLKAEFSALNEGNTRLDAESTEVAEPVDVAAKDESGQKSDYGDDDSDDDSDLGSLFEDRSEHEGSHDDEHGSESNDGDGASDDDDSPDDGRNGGADKVATDADLAREDHDANLQGLSDDTTSARMPLENGQRPADMPVPEPSPRRASFTMNASVSDFVPSVRPKLPVPPILPYHQAYIASQQGSNSSGSVSVSGSASASASPLPALQGFSAAKARNPHVQLINEEVKKLEWRRNSGQPDLVEDEAGIPLDDGALDDMYERQVIQFLTAPTASPSETDAGPDESGSDGEWSDVKDSDHEEEDEEEEKKENADEEGDAMPVLGGVEVARAFPPTGNNFVAMLGNHRVTRPPTGLPQQGVAAPLPAPQSDSPAREPSPVATTEAARDGEPATRHASDIFPGANDTTKTHDEIVGDAFADYVREHGTRTLAPPQTHPPPAEGVAAPHIPNQFSNGPPPRPAHLRPTKPQPPPGAPTGPRAERSSSGASLRAPPRPANFGGPPKPQPPPNAPTGPRSHASPLRNEIRATTAVEMNNAGMQQPSDAAPAVGGDNRSPRGNGRGGRGGRGAHGSSTTTPRAAPAVPGAGDDFRILGASGRGGSGANDGRGGGRGAYRQQRGPTAQTSTPDTPRVAPARTTHPANNSGNRTPAANKGAKPPRGSASVSSSFKKQQELMAKLAREGRSE